MFKNLIFFLAWVGIFIISALEILNVFVPGTLQMTKDMIIQYVPKFMDFSYIVVLLSSFYFALTIVKLLALFKTRKDYEIQTENGIIRVSSTSITGAVKEILSNDNEVSNIKVNSFKKGKKLILQVTLQLVTNTNIVDKTSTIKELVQKALSDKLGFNIDKIDIHISKLTVKKAEFSKKYSEEFGKD